MYRNSLRNKDKIFSVAPMMDWTDRHCRVFHRLISRHALLYSEMVTADAVIHGDRQRLIGFSEEEQPVALQLGGCDPVKLADAAKIAEGFGYDEINLNVGCPSNRVQSGRFGACLMAEPELVRDCVGAMREAVMVPVTVKCRIGIDDQDNEVDLNRFVDCVAEAGIETFIVHARKAWLEGLSPKQNRDVPPLDYECVYRLKRRRDDLTIIINGGIETLDEADGHLEHVDGVMLGRAAYQTPYVLAQVDQRYFGSIERIPTRAEIIANLIPYIEMQMHEGVRMHQITRHILGLYHGQPRARAWRRHLSEVGVRADSGVEVLGEALKMVEDSGSFIAA